MANTFTLIASSTVGAGGASSIDFTSIPSTYTDLCLVHSLRGTNANTYSYINVKFNDATTNYSNKNIFGNSTSVASYGYTTLSYLYTGFSEGDSATANTYGNGQIYIPNYAGSNPKSVSFEQVSENNSGSADAAFAVMNAGLWNNTSAITKISLINDSGNWKQYSTAYLYGIKNS